MIHSSKLSFTREDLIALEGNPDDPSLWTRFLEDLKGAFEGEWIYRGVDDKRPEDLTGDREKEFQLLVESSFDREWSNRWLEDINANRWNKDTPWAFRWAYEADLLREFKRAAHHFRTDLPAKYDFLEWLSLGRHFGMPCRLVDFSYSYWVPTYFALSGKSMDKYGYVLALSLDFLNKNIEELQGAFWLKRNPNASQKDYLQSVDFPKYDYHNPKHFHRFAFNEDCPFRDVVVPVRPGRKNERLIAQQGLFLCQGNISVTFAEALSNTLKKAVERGSKRKELIRLIVFPSGWRSVILEELSKTNIKGSVLFPDLQGFGQSLRDNFHRDINEKTSERVMSELRVSISKTPWF